MIGVSWVWWYAAVATLSALGALVVGGVRSARGKYVEDALAAGLFTALLWPIALPCWAAYGIGLGIFRLAEAITKLRKARAELARRARNERSLTRSEYR